MEPTIFEPQQESNQTTLTIQSKKVLIENHQHDLVQPFILNKGKLPNTTCIKIQGNSYSKRFCEWFSEQLKMAPKLKELNINDIFVSRSKEEIPNAIKQISKGLIGSNLLRLDISNNAVNPFGAKALLHFLQQAKSLEVLLISNCGLGPLGVAEIAKGLRGTPNLKVLSIARNRMENQGILSIAQILQFIHHLQQLFIYQNTLKKEGLQKLFKQMRKHCKEIISFDLCDNFVRQQATQEMALLIMELSILNLNLSDCLNENENQKIITAFEKTKNRQFERLGFNFIEMSPQIAKRLLQVMKQCSKMKKLDIMGNEFPQKIKKLMSEELGDIISHFDDEDDDEDEMVKLFEEMRIC